MLTLTGMFKSIFDLRRGANRLLAGQRPIAPRTARGILRNTATDEEQFMASLAGLSPEQRQQRIAKREWYRQLVERQGRIEAEHTSAQVD